MVTPEEFERIRAEIRATGPASNGDNLHGMEIDACAYLGDPSYARREPQWWTGMSVVRSASAEGLIIGRASGRAANAPAISAELSRIWDHELRYNFRSAHALTATPDSVTIRAITQIGPADIWVEADVRVQLT